MKTIILAIATLALSLTAACGDNMSAPNGEREGIVIITPRAGQVLDALESAEEAGFFDPSIDEDTGTITAIGDLSLLDDARELPGIEDIVPGDSLRREVYDRDLAIPLGPAAVEANGKNERPHPINWDDNLARL